MWKYVEFDAYNTISLHDCRADQLWMEGEDLIVSFPDGFWVTPASHHIDHHTSLKTGSSQLRFIGLGADSVIDHAHLYKTTYLFHKPVLCRRITLEAEKLMKLVNDREYSLEFLYEFHRSPSRLYQCCLWRRNYIMESDCQLEITAKAIEYRWNEIRNDRELYPEWRKENA